MFAIGETVTLRTYTNVPFDDTAAVLLGTELAEVVGNTDASRGVYWVRPHNSEDRIFVDVARLGKYEG